MVDAKITMEYKDFRQLERESEFYKKEYSEIVDFIKGNVKVTDGECMFEGENAPCENGKDDIKCRDCDHFKKLKYDIKDPVEFGNFLARIVLDK